jgi:hypothetical protein
MLVDGENVRRSAWPNIPRERLAALAGAWAEVNGARAEVIWEGAESADDRIAARAADLAAAGEPYWLVTSDRELRARAGGAAARVIGGGALARELERPH